MLSYESHFPCMISQSYTNQLKGLDASHMSCVRVLLDFFFFFLLFLTTGVPVSSKFLGTHCTLCCDNSFLGIVFLVLGYNIIISLASFSFN